MRLFCAVVRVPLVRLNVLNVRSRLLTVVEKQKARFPIRHVRKRFMHLQMTLHTVVVRAHDWYAAQHEDFRHGLAGVFLSAPHIRRSKCDLDLLVRQRHVQNPLRRVLHNQAGFLKLSVHVRPAILVHGKPTAREHVQAVVECAVSPPVLRNLKRRNHMPVS